MTNFRLAQAWTIARLELRRVFFSKRGFWVYLLALFPSVIFFGHALEVKLSIKRWSQKGLTPAAIVDSFRVGETATEVLARAPAPVFDRSWRHRREEGDGPAERHMMYFDGKRRADLHFQNGILRWKNLHARVNGEEDRKVFAAVFHYFYLRLAIFFGCLGIFVNLFRGEMMDKTLHFWFLGPARREVLLGGKYLAGLIAAVVIFGTGVLLSFGLMLWPQDPAEAQAYWQHSGLSDAISYVAAAGLACIGYGSVFLAAGLLLRNPIIPAVVLLLWEAINNFLPAILQQFSVLHYVQAICPVPPPMENDTPALLRLVFSPAEPPSPVVAVMGLLVLTGLVLWTASRAVRRLEINYGTD